MTKQRSNYLYELVGIIREKKNNSKKERVSYKLTVEISNLENIPFIQVWQDLIKDKQIWATITKDGYIDKKYLFYCQNWMSQYRLEVMTEVVNYEEFKDKIRIFTINLAKDLKQGKKTEQNIYVLLGPPGIGKSYIAEKLSEATDRHLINIDLGGRKDTGILEGVSPSTKSAFAGRICQEIASSKDRGSIIFLDEFEKVADEGLANLIGNLLDSKKNKDWFDQFLGYRIDLSNCILICTANHMKQIKDFVENRSEMINIELATYQQKKEYTLEELRKKLTSDTDTAHYAQQITADFAKYIITEEWGYRQLNKNIDNVYKTVRAYVDPALSKPIADLTKWEKLEQTANRWTFTYQQGQKITLIRVRNENEAGQSPLTPELNLNWPAHEGFIKPKVAITK